MPGTVVELFRYPVKSLGGESLQRAAVTPRGLAADRVLAVYTDDGGIGSGKTTQRFRRVDGLLRLAARLDGGRPVIDFADGTTAPAQDPDTDQRLSELLGRPLSVRAEAAVSHHDDCPVHVVTTASLRRLEELLGEPVDVRRLRPNIVVDLPGAGFAEDDWKGRRLAVGGGLVLEVTAGMPRCVMVNADQIGLSHDSRLLKLIAREHDLEVGVQATVVRPGPVAVGDEVRLA